LNFCEYGCRREAHFQFKNGKWCCSRSWKKCPVSRKKTSNQVKGKNHPLYGKISPIRGRVSPNKLNIEKIKTNWKFFAQIEEMRYNPDKPGKKEIQVHCKNHNCPNSKEKGGWFTPTGRQIEARLDALENKEKDLSYFYCSNECKQTCILYNLHSDPFKDTELPYTPEEKQIWNETVLEQDNYSCQYCGSKENLHCHHIIPIKLDPMLALDPDNGIVLCENCHYKIGHGQNGCKTGQLANKQCNQV
jgi:hypothetical protein